MHCRQITPGLLALCCMALAGCRDQSGAHPVTHEVSESERIPRLTFQDAEHIDVYQTSSDSPIIVDVHSPLDDTSVQARYEFAPEGTKAPQKAVHLPANRLVCMSSTHIGFLAELDALDKVAAVTAARNVASPRILEGIENGDVAEVGEMGTLDLERLVAVQPDAVIAYGITEADLAVYDPIRRMGIPVLLCAEYTESTPLARAEWIRFFGLLIGKEKQANELYERIRRDYISLAEKAQSANPKPTVMLNTSFQGVWYMAGGESYMARLLADAGTDYLWSDDRSARVLRLDFEAVLHKASDAEYWLNTGFWKSLADGEANDSRYTLFRPFQTGNVFNNNPTSDQDAGRDFYERGAVRPDFVLADLVKIFHPDLVPNHNFVWYHRLPKQ